MDAQRLCTLRRVSRCTRGTRRIQWEVHVQPVRFTRWLLCYFARSHSPQLPKFLSAREALAIHRHSAGGRSEMNHETRAAVLDREPAQADFLSETIAGLSNMPRTLPCKYFYDVR